jgi:hypothetical protein
MKIGGDSSSVRARKKARESSGMRGKGAGVTKGGARPFIGVGGTGEAVAGR